MEDTRDRMPDRNDVVVMHGPPTTGEVVHRYVALYGNTRWRAATQEERAEYERERERLRQRREEPDLDAIMARARGNVWRREDIRDLVRAVRERNAEIECLESIHREEQKARFQKWLKGIGDKK